MYLRISLFIITIMCIKSIASDQLTFSSDTVEFKRRVNMDWLYITNNTDSVVSIDTLHFNWEIYGVRQSEPIGIAFSMGMEGVMYDISKIIEMPDTSFCFYTKMWQYAPDIIIQPHEKKMFDEFMFGSHIGVLGVLREKWSDGNVSIRMTFINNQSGRDTVIFVGDISDLISSGVIPDNAGCFRMSTERTPEKDIFLVSGRKIIISGRMNNRKLIPCNLYFTKSGRAPITVNNILK